MIGQFVAANTGTILSVGGSIVVAAIGAYAMVRARRVVPGREPTPFKDIWDENRATRDEARAAEKEARRLEGVANNQRNAIQVMWDYVNELVHNWGKPEVPRLSADDRAIIERVKPPDVSDLDAPTS